MNRLKASSKASSGAVIKTFIPAAMIAASFFISSCSSFYTVKGTVTDCASGSAISNAQLDLKCEYEGNVKTGETNSDASGGSMVLLNHPPWGDDSDLTVSAEGFRPRTTRVHHSFDEEQSVCLEKDVEE